jgi:hypothetical protein
MMEILERCISGILGFRTDVDEPDDCRSGICIGQMDPVFLLADGEAA